VGGVSVRAHIIVDHVQKGIVVRSKPGASIATRDHAVDVGEGVFASFRPSCSKRRPALYECPILGVLGSRLCLCSVRKGIVF